MTTICCRGDIIVEAQRVVPDAMRGTLIEAVAKCASCKRSLGPPTMLGQRQGRPCTYTLDMTRAKGSAFERLVSEVQELGRALESVVAQHGPEAMKRLNVWQFLHEFRALRDGTSGLQAVAEKELERLKQQIQRHIGRLDAEHVETERRQQRRSTASPVAMYRAPWSSDFSTPSQASNIGHE